MILFGTIFLIFINLSVCAVFPVPNQEDISFWHNSNIKYLENILKSYPEGKITKPAKNVILFIGDGMSMATIAAGRVLKGQLKGKSGEETELVFEKFSHLGLSKTYNTDSQVPDSAGTATALFSGIKTGIKVIGLNMPDLTTCRDSDRLKTIIDWAQDNQKRTGIVTTTRITHATPAAAFAYSPNRDYECDTKVPSHMSISGFKDIGLQLVENNPGKNLNVIFGGGRDFLGATIKERKEKVIKFSGGAENSCNRTDRRNLVDEYLKQFEKDEIVKYVTNTEELNSIDYDNVDHVLGLFANNHMSYESIRDTGIKGEPSLTKMTESAIKILNNRKNNNGFVLIVEGGKIDHAHHQNHARLALEEFVEFERAVELAKNMTSTDETLIVVTSDHSHSMVYNGYASRGNDILEFANKKNSPLYETLVYSTGPGYFYHMSNDSNHSSILENISMDERKDPLYMHQSLIPLSDGNHAGEDVPVYSNGPNSFLLQRVFEQSYIPYAISYSACIGPVGKMNPSCSIKILKSNGTESLIKNNFIFLILIFLYFI